jgi:phosphoenolpyruvate---glycerone phosphotransferase subunit DhaM
MAVVSVVLISHSERLGAGLKDILSQLTEGKVHIEDASGVDGELGTSAVRVLDAILACPDEQDIVILFDLGSALLSCETAVDLLHESTTHRIHLVDAPLVEGAIAAALEASLGSTIDVVVKSAMSAKGLNKLDNR